MAFEEKFPEIQDHESLTDHPVEAGKEPFTPQNEFLATEHEGGREAFHDAVAQQIIDSKSARFEMEATHGAQEILKNLELKHAETEALLATMGPEEALQYKIDQANLSNEKIDEIVGDTNNWYAKILKGNTLKSATEILNKVYAIAKNRKAARASHSTDLPSVH